MNGSAGIAVGMATNIPPHNLGEVIDGVVALIENPAVTIRELERPDPVHVGVRLRVEPLLVH